MTFNFLFLIFLRERTFFYYIQISEKKNISLILIFFTSKRISNFTLYFFKKINISFNNLLINNKSFEKD